MGYAVWIKTVLGWKFILLKFSVPGDDSIPSDPLNTLLDIVQELENREAEENDEDSDEEEWQTVSEGNTDFHGIRVIFKEFHGKK